MVNGPGEAKVAHIGVTGGEPNMLYLNGTTAGKVGNEELLDTLEREIRAKIEAGNNQT